MLFKRIIKRMVPKKKYKGQIALSLLTVQDSCPDELGTVNYMVCPKSLIKYTADPIRKFCHLKDLCKGYGWKYHGVVEKQNARVKEIRTKFKEENMLMKENELKIRESERFKRRVDELMAQIE